MDRLLLSIFYKVPTVFLLKTAKLILTYCKNGGKAIYLSHIVGNVTENVTGSAGTSLTTPKVSQPEVSASTLTHV